MICPSCFTRLSTQKMLGPKRLIACRWPALILTCDSTWRIRCQLAQQNSPAIAPASHRVDANYDSPHQVLEAVHEILGDRYLWGFGNLFSSWCDNQIRGLYNYQQEAAVLSQLDPALHALMTNDAPQAWLFAGKERPR
ncbi:MAG: hypothetical protein CMJ72_12515 [Planctomycetaceae bacterium]|nr:hypothetical protein [Planctomycetaceae bacterium]